MKVWIHNRVYFVLLTLVMFALSACAGFETNSESATDNSIRGNPARGEQLILNYGCGACHTIPGITGADTNVGPPLTHLSQQRIIAGILVNTPDSLSTFIQSPTTVQPNTTMPDMGVTPEDALDIVAYLYTLN